MRRVNLILRSADGPEEVRVEGAEDLWTVTRGGETRRVRIAWLADERISVICENGRHYCGRVFERGPGRLEVSTPAGGRELLLADPLHDRLAHPVDSGEETAEEEVRALMPGRVVEVLVSEGDVVLPNALLLVLEAMKMQNEIRASRPGIVLRRLVEANRAVDKGALLLLLGPNPRVESG